MRFAVSKNGKEIGTLQITPTPQHNFEEGMRICKEMGELLRGKEGIEKVAGGIAGSFNKDHTALLRSPHIQGWIGKPLKERLEGIFGAPVSLENDAALAGLGEAIAGAGRGYGIVAYVAVGTGVGGVRIVDAKIDRNAAGFEIGHQIINYNDNENDKARTLEEYVSGSALQKRFGEKPEHISNPETWKETAEILAVGLRNTILHWSPDVLVLGGPVALQSAFSFELFKEYLTKSVLEVFPTAPKIKKAELGDKSGLYGALFYPHP